jgi:hypothetical protein
MHDVERIRVTRGDELHLGCPELGVEVAGEDDGAATARRVHPREQVPDLLRADRAALRRVMEVGRIGVHLATAPGEAHVRDRTVVVRRIEVALSTRHHGMRGEDRVAVALRPFGAVDGRELQAIAEAVRECPRLVRKLGILEDLLEAEDVRSDPAHLGDDDVQPLRPLVRVVPEVERHDGQRVGRARRGRGRDSNEREGHEECAVGGSTLRHAWNLAHGRPRCAGVKTTSRAADDPSERARIRVAPDDARTPMDSRRPNECPRCGFAYTAFNRPKPANSTFGQRFTRNLRERRKFGIGPLAEIRYVQAEQARPFPCRCGTWLRPHPWSFGVVDVIGIVVIAAIQVVLSVQFPWMRNKYVFAVPIALWVFYRTTRQVAVSEVPAAELEAMKKDAA